jgi:UMF1 family MFS transporter
MTTPPTAPPVRRREIFGWAMFDFANSAYTTLVVTVAFSVFFKTAVSPGSGGDALWGLGLTVSNVLVMVLSVLVGAIADGAAKKKAFLAVTWTLMIAGTAALGLVGPGDVGLALALFVVSNIAFSLGENLVGAFLPEISTPRTIGRISGIGWGLGYVGGLLVLFAVFSLIKGGFDVDNLANLRWTWGVTALFILLAGLPTFLFLRERALPSGEQSWGRLAADGLGRVAQTVREIGHFRQLARFLAAFFCYQAGLTTVIAFASIYAVETIGFDSGELIVLFMVLNVSAAVGALAFGFVQDKIGAKLTVQITLVLWIAVVTAAFLVETKAGFWGVAVTSGLGIGSLQSASRALVGLFSPVEKSGEFFGFWGLAGKAAYAAGPLAFGFVSAQTGSQRWAILSTAIFFALGLAGTFLVDETKGRQAAEAWDRRERARDLAGDSAA